MALRRHLTRGSTVLLVAGALLAGTGATALLWPRPRVVAEVGSVVIAPPPAPTSSAAPSSAAPTRVPTPAGFVPRRLVIRSVGIDAPLTPTVVDAEGALVPPDDPAHLAWWRGVRPGHAAGSVLVAGHLDVVGYDVGPLARIVDLQEGDTAVLRGAGGATAEYVLRGVTTIPKESLPAADLFGTRGPERLVLVTCGGTFDPDAHGWDSNVVAVLDPVPAG